ncbi:MAG: HAD family hydrolase [Elstera sp.]
MRPTTIVFDFGGVLVDWDRNYLYRTLIPDPAERARFLNEICDMRFNERFDLGEPHPQIIDDHVRRHPHYEALIRAYYARWDEMIGGGLADGIALVEALHGAGYPLFGLSNWSDEFFARTRLKFPVFERFQHIVLSGEVKMVKPDPAIFHHLFAAIARKPEEIVFLDDNAANVAAARALGIETIHWVGAADAIPRLRSLGFSF